MAAALLLDRPELDSLTVNPSTELADDQVSDRPTPSEAAAPLEIAAVAHELRAPLTSLVLAAELLLDDAGKADPKHCQRMATLIHQQAHWLNGLLDNLLCSATISNDRLRLTQRPVNLPKVVADVRSLVQPQLQRQNQRLRITTRGRIPRVSVDCQRIGQVLVNLITNASKFAPSNTALDVVLAPKGDAVRVSVADRGPGLPAGSAERLFEPLCRSAEAICAGVEGVGLGLAIVKHIVEAHGGRVGGENRPGGGARFWFELPAPHVARVDGSPARAMETVTK